MRAKRWEVFRRARVVRTDYPPYASLIHLTSGEEPSPQVRSPHLSRPKRSKCHLYSIFEGIAGALLIQHMHYPYDDQWFNKLTACLPFQHMMVL